ncbi:MAG: Beta-barrel assembly-enhancing protease [Alphaproteobacteria bacterium MarineAlpha11_Bin1]|nr:MAG: Beta-barrel assembly-enhancing protease [Alphaproteobacteria bacterium MarineAlpha11_Bin1]|tara:strand:+ start:1598 stop:3316 length:1719 start_codon:yes stop_codon:yes gene_type:complete
MRGSSLTTIVAAVSAIAFLATCTPDETAPVERNSGVSEKLVSSAGNYLAGRQAQKSRDFGNASLFLGKALAESPSNTSLLRKTFLARLAEGDIAAAVPMAREITKRMSSAPFAKLVLLVDCVRRNDLVAADAVLADFPDRGINGFIRPILMSWVSVGKMEVIDPIQELSSLKNQSDLRVLYNLNAAFVSDVIGRTSDAEKYYKLAIQKFPASTLRAVQAYGRHLERQGKREKARLLYNTYIHENPNSVIIGPAIARLKRGQRPTLLVSTPAEGVAEALFYVAGIMTRQNSEQLALIYGYLALHLRKDLDLARMLAAGILESMDRNEDAIVEYRNIRPKSPFHWSARLRVAGNLEVLNRDDEAIDLLRKLANEDKTNPEPLISLGDLFRSNKQFTESVAAYDQAIAMISGLDKRQWMILYSRGIALERSKQWGRAELDFKRALELSPDQPYVLNYLGYSWVDQGVNLERARTMIERAVELRPDDGYIVDSLGWVLYRLRDFAGAVENLERAVELRPNDPTINDHLGDAYWRVGRYTEAQFQWRRALSLNPEEDQVAPIESKLLQGLRMSNEDE